MPLLNTAKISTTDFRKNDGKAFFSIMKTASLTDLRKNLKNHLDSVINDYDTAIINRDGNTGVVIISLEEYGSIKETEYIMSSPKTVKRIKEGTQSIAEGEGKSILMTLRLHKSNNAAVRRIENRN